MVSIKRISASCRASSASCTPLPWSAENPIVISQSFSNKILFTFTQFSNFPLHWTLKIFIIFRQFVHIFFLLGVSHFSYVFNWHAEALFSLIPLANSAQDDNFRAHQLTAVEIEKFTSFLLSCLHRRRSRSSINLCRESVASEKKIQYAAVSSPIVN